MALLMTATFFTPLACSFKDSLEEDAFELRVNEDEHYVFNIEKNTLIFEMGIYAESLIEIGTVFVLSKNT